MTLFRDPNFKCHGSQAAERSDPHASNRTSLDKGSYLGGEHGSDVDQDESGYCDYRGGCGKE